MDRAVSMLEVHVDNKNAVGKGALSGGEYIEEEYLQLANSTLAKVSGWEYDGIDNVRLATYFKAAGMTATLHAQEQIVMVQDAPLLREEINEYTTTKGRFSLQKRIGRLVFLEQERGRTVTYAEIGRALNFMQEVRQQSGLTLDQLKWRYDKLTQWIAEVERGERISWR
jgi:hypothetical protein